MIKSFRDKETEKLFRRRISAKLPSNLQRPALRKLVLLDSADNLMDLSLPPSNRLEKLRGDRKGEYSIRINDQWRVCFRWRDGHVFDVEIVDYH